MIRGSLMLLALLPAWALAEQLWLDEDLAPVDKDEASFYMETLQQDGERWPIKVFYLEGGVRLEGTLDGPDLASGGLVGPYRFFRANGVLQEEGSRDAQYRHHGDLQAYHPNGQLRLSQHYRNGVLQGEASEYHDNGQLESTGEFVDGRRRDGECLHYDSEGRLAARHFYLDGELDGVAERYREGRLLVREHYSKGVAQGLRQSFREDGSLSSEQTLKNGKLEGLDRRWERNDVLAIEAHYRNDKHDGAFRVFAEKGHLLEESEYRAGIQVGASRRYHLSGELREEELLDDRGERQHLTRYDVEGRKQYYEVREKGPRGQQVRKEHYYPGGALMRREQNGYDDRWSLREEFAEDGSQTARSEQRNGQAHGLHLSVNYEGGRQQEHYRDGERDGEFLLQSSAGEVLGKGRYRAGKRIGEWLEVSGDLRMLNRFDEQGRLHGEQRRELRDGELLQIDRYQHGKLHGRHERYEGGTLVDVGSYRDDLRDGEWQTRLFDGRAWRGSYHRGRQVGLWEARSEQGYLLESGRYDAQGRPQGKHYGFADDGGLLKLERYDAGNLHGLSEYFVDGRRYMVIEYAQGQLLETRHDEPDPLFGH